MNKSSSHSLGVKVSQLDPGPNLAGAVYGVSIIAWLLKEFHLVVNDIITTRVCPIRYRIPPHRDLIVVNLHLYWWIHPLRNFVGSYGEDLRVQAISDTVASLNTELYGTATSKWLIWRLKREEIC
jgi:hypothetical protein